MFPFLNSHIVYTFIVFWIFEIICAQKEKEITPQMKNDLKAWCVSDKGHNKGYNACDATQECCKPELGTCFELYGVRVNTHPLAYCLVKSNSKENAAKVKECCLTKHSRRKKHTGQDGNSVVFNGTNKYIDCVPSHKRHSR